MIRDLPENYYLLLELNYNLCRIVSGCAHRIVGAMDLFRSPVFVTKVTEIVLSLFSILCITASLYPSAECIFFSEVVYATFYGYLLINLIIMLGFFITEPLSQRLSLIISLTAAVLHLFSFLILVQSWEILSLKRYLASAVFTILNCFAFVFDFVFFWKYGGDLQ